MCRAHRETQMNRYTTLFEQQSYKDALDYYMSSLENEKLPVWDYVILTASNEAQAKAYREQIAHRMQQENLPHRTQFAVIPDRNGLRVGSGGATLSCIRYVAQQTKDASFAGKKILVIHSGGDSKRVPQYSACGKLFSPVPRLLPDGRRSTLFDEFMIGMSTVASRITEGMLICSGDVLLLFNALQIDFYGAGAAALSIKENVQTGKNHGVYWKDEKGFVGRFLHKQTVETLQAAHAVDERGNVDIDTGAVILSADILRDLYGLVASKAQYERFVNETARLSFYADFLYPMASESTLEQFYGEKPEGDFTPELRECRTALWEVLSKYRMKLIQFSPASFIHFGTTRELLHLMTDGMEEYYFLGWSSVIGSNLNPDDYAVSGSYISRGAVVGKGSYIEDSRLHRETVIGEKCVISGVTMRGVRVPDGSVLHGLKLSDGRFVCRMYGVEDNPKEASWFGKALSKPLWTAKLFPVCDTIEEAVTKTLAEYKKTFGSTSAAPEGDESMPQSSDKNSDFVSLQESFALADVTAILPWQENLQEQIVAEAILEKIKSGIPALQVKEQYPHIDHHTIHYLVQRAEELSVQILPEFSQKIRIYQYLSVLTGERQYADTCFQTIREATLAKRRPAGGFKLQEDVTVNLPVRVNFGGGWSDTPPYCMENGGTVLNAAISLGGALPIEVTVRRIDQPVIALASTDIGSYKEFGDLGELLDCSNPSDPFALHKAALISCGVTTEQDSVEALCAQLGSGMYMNTRVIDIPKGSGLGTSSILAGACVVALSKVMHETLSEEDVFQRVLGMEQLMSTGGGWQDQVGGLVPGCKMITTRPGLEQEIDCTKLKLSDETMEELNERFAIIYTGQRRLARNLLREVVGRYISNDRGSIEAHYNIQRLAVLMRFELEKGNIDGFAKLLSEHWEESKRIDAGSTNTAIELIFSTIEDLICGRMICGAGGGGFLQVVLKKGVTKQMLRERLREVFQESGVDVWDCAFV